MKKYIILSFLLVSSILLNAQKICFNIDKLTEGSTLESEKWNNTDSMRIVEVKTYQINGNEKAGNVTIVLEWKVSDQKELSTKGEKIRVSKKERLSELQRVLDDYIRKNPDLNNAQKQEHENNAYQRNSLFSTIFN